MCVARTFSDPSASTPPQTDSSLDFSAHRGWHARDAKNVTDVLGVEPTVGLTTSQVNERQLRFGRNALQKVRPRPAWKLFVDQFKSIVIALLAIAALVSFLTNDIAEAIAILIVLIINAAVGFSTEWQAGRALDALRRQTRTISRVRRNAFETTVDAEELVPGDIVVLNSGDRVPADHRLLEAFRLETEESALTGESATVDKSVEPVSQQTSLAERKCMLYLGTAIAAGRALAVVVSTGSTTELGQIGRLVSLSTKESSPLQIQLTRLGRQLVYLVVIIAVLVMMTGWLRGDGLWIMVEVGISLAVAAVPEGLPAVTTLILALGVLRMARRHAIMRRLPAVETLGSTTVICADKTGTLTENRMRVREYYLSDGRRVEVDKGQTSLDGDELLEQAVRIGVLCNEASFREDASDESRTIGDPTETALLVVADALVLDVSHERDIHPKVGEQPFETSTKRMTTLHLKSDGDHLAALKGAPSVVLAACLDYRDALGNKAKMDASATARFIAANEQMANCALRVLALAVKHFDTDVDQSSDEALESGYTFIGLVGMIDPPRPGVAEAIRRARVAGIRTVMLTGDQLNTGLAIARELGLGDGDPSALHARDLLNVDQSRLANLAHNTDVFARVSPEEKLRIVEALQQAGEVVAVTGDGVNDAPALKRANIGIAMGQRGTEVAKEAADVVLADDNFETILVAIEGGRSIYANIIKFVHMMFSHNLGEVIMIFTAIAAGWPLPLLPLQILWMNLVTDIFPALALAVEPASAEIMNQPPRSSRSTILSRPFLFLIGWQAVMLGGFGLGSYLWALQRYGPGAHSRTVALFALVGVQLGHMFNCRSRTRSALDGLFRNPFIWIAAIIVVLLQMLAAYFSPLSTILETVKPFPIDWGVIGACSLATIVIVEIAKLTFRWRKNTISDLVK